MTGCHGGAKGNASAVFGQRAVLPFLERGNSWPRSTLCPTRCGRSSNCLPEYQQLKSAGHFTFRRLGGFNDFRGRHSVLIMTTIYLDLETIGTDDASGGFRQSPRQPQEG